MKALKFHLQSPCWEECLEQFYSNAKDVLFLLDREGKIVDFRPGEWLRLFGSRHTLLQRRFDRLRNMTNALAASHFLAGLSRHKSQEGTIGFRDVAGKDVEFSVTGYPAFQDGAYLGALLLLRNHQEFAGQNAMSNFLGLYDRLTGLPNRIYFHDCYIAALEQSRLSGEPLSLLYISLDNLKSINQAFGLSAGDLLLQEFGAKLKEAATAVHQSIVSRLFGDEFVVLLEKSGAEASAALAEAILAACRRPFLIKGMDIVALPYIGIVSSPADGYQDELLLRKAEEAMETAKRSGRVRYQFYREDRHQELLLHNCISIQLARALENRELELHYQPQLELATGNLTGIEALLRWSSPELGSVPPSKFIPIAEQTGLIEPIGEWVLRTACRQNKEWQKAGLKPVRIAVNLSAAQLYQVDVVELVDEVLQESGLEPCYLELEITESISMDAPKAIDLLKRLKELGVSISLDDFGTGYSSLKYLKQFPVDKLKIDRSFVQDLQTNAQNHTFVSAIIMIAKTLKLMVLAEGVEQDVQRELLEVSGCDEVQGYLISKPLNREEMSCYYYEAHLEEAVRSSKGG